MVKIANRSTTSPVAYNSLHFGIDKARNREHSRAGDGSPLLLGIMFVVTMMQSCRHRKPLQLET